jgi:hypothetical protein
MNFDNLKFEFVSYLEIRICDLLIMMETLIFESYLNFGY